MFKKLAVAASVAVLYCAGGSGQNIFGAAYIGPNGLATLYSILPATGAATAIGAIGASTVSALAIGPNSTLYGVGFTNAGFALLRINPVTGAGTVIGLTGIGGPFQDMDFRPSDGKLFGYGGGSIYTINIATGAATLVGNTGNFPFGNALAFSPSNILYNANETSLDVINQSNGTVTSHTPLTFSPAFGSGFTRPSAMKFHPNGTLYASIVTDGATRTWSLGTINVGTGAVTRIGPTVSGLDALAIGTPAGPSGVPAPSSWLLVSLGIVGVVLFQLIRKTRIL